MRLVWFLGASLLISTTGRADALSAARQHYEQGTKAYDLGRYREAVKEYEAAYEEKPDPAILFNLGQAYRLAGDYVNAIRSYRSFLRRLPDTENRSEVESRIVDLQKLMDQQAATKERESTPPLAGSAPPAASLPSETAPPTTRPPVRDGHADQKIKIAGFATGAVGVGALVAGVTFGVLAKQAGDDLSRISETMQHFDPAKERSGLTDQTLEIVFVTVGGAAVVTGAVLVAIGMKRSRQLQSLAVRSVDRSSF